MRNSNFSSCFLISSLAVRITQSLLSISAVIVSTIHVRSMMKWTPLLAKTKVFHSSGLDFVTGYLVLLGIFSAFASAFIAVSLMIADRVGGESNVYFKPQRAIVPDIIFSILWSLAAPLMVIESPDKEQELLSYLLLCATCGSALLSWAVSLGIDWYYYEIVEGIHQPESELNERKSGEGASRAKYTYAYHPYGQRLDPYLL
ncbi:uncharacterized protein V1518DRAFT_411669 [Limtongia smithiae]|uniref:uncharacterized protein n=1 Tax=Limtongia smithiae TaxID=1125753 RepID=UPI0034CEEDDF